MVQNTTKFVEKYPLKNSNFLEVIDICNALSGIVPFIEF